MDTRTMLKCEVKAQIGAFRAALKDDSGEKIESLINEALDIEFTRSFNGEFRGFSLTLCLGGPNVYLNHHVSQSEAFVEGYWAGDSVKIHLGIVESDILWDYMEELVDCMK